MKGEGGWYRPIRRMETSLVLLYVQKTFTPTLDCISRALKVFIPLPHSLKKKCEKAEKTRRGEKKRPIRLKQTTGRQLYSISCCMLFLSQGLFRCTNWVEVGNGHESKPVFPSTLGLMRATWRNVRSHPTPSPCGLFFLNDKKETMSSSKHPLSFEAQNRH